MSAKHLSKPPHTAPLASRPSFVAPAAPREGGEPLQFHARNVADGGVPRIDLEDAARGAGLSVCPARGAEVSSLRVREAGGVHELLYRGNDWSPTSGWDGRAPWLWPVAGRCYARGVGGADPDRCDYRLGDGVLPMPIHGFARRRVWDAGPALATPGGVRVAMTCRDRPDDHAFYPFGYTLRADASLDPAGTALSFSCIASGENQRPMPFTFGCHLTLDLRSWWGENWLGGTVRGLGTRAWSTGERMQVGGEIALPDAPRLSHASLGSALVPASPGSAVRLVSPDGERALSLSFEIESSKPRGGAEALSGGGQPLWVVYRDPAGAYFCCEPWVGWPNAINTGRGRVSLSPGEQWAVTLRLRAESGGGSGGGVPVAANRRNIVAHH